MNYFKFNGVSPVEWFSLVFALFYSSSCVTAGNLSHQSWSAIYAPAIWPLYTLMLASLRMRKEGQEYEKWA